MATHGVVVDLHALLARSRLSGEVQVRITGGNTPAFGHLTDIRARNQAFARRLAAALRAVFLRGRIILSRP